MKPTEKLKEKLRLASALEREAEKTIAKGLTRDEVSKIAQDFNAQYAVPSEAK